MTPIAAFQVNPASLTAVDSANAKQTTPPFITLSTSGHCDNSKPITEKIHPKQATTLPLSKSTTAVDEVNPKTKTAPAQACPKPTGAPNSPLPMIVVNSDDPDSTRSDRIYENPLLTPKLMTKDVGPRKEKE